MEEAGRAAGGYPVLSIPLLFHLSPVDDNRACNKWLDFSMSKLHTINVRNGTLLPNNGEIMKRIAIVAACVALTGCATALTPSGENVRIISAEQASHCKRIKLVTFNQRLGPDKPGNAMKAALNETAATGGDSFLIVSTAMDWAEGASIAGESHRCN